MGYAECRSSVGTCPFFLISTFLPHRLKHAVMATKRREIQMMMASPQFQSCLTGSLLDSRSSTTRPCPRESKPRIGKIQGSEIYVSMRARNVPSLFWCVGLVAVRGAAKPQPKPIAHVVAFHAHTLRQHHAHAFPKSVTQSSPDPKFH